MNQLPPAAILVFAVASVAIAGGLFLWLISYVLRGRKDEQETESADMAPTDAPSSSAFTAPGPGDVVPADSRELLRVSRVQGELVVFVQGQGRRSLREITDPQVGRDTIEAIRAVMAFAGSWLPSIRQQMGGAGQGEGDRREPPARATAPPPRSRPPRAPTPGVDPPAAAQAASPGAMLDPLLLIEDIDALVQQRLKDHPELAGRYVKLSRGVGGGLCIFVDRDVFDAVGDVSDEAVRVLIQEAIREWEER